MKTETLHYLVQLQPGLFWNKQKNPAISQDVWLLHLSNQALFISMVTVKVFSRQSMEQTKLSLYILLDFSQVDRTSNCEEIIVHLKIRCVQINWRETILNKPNDVTYKFPENVEEVLVCWKLNCFFQVVFHYFFGECWFYMWGTSVKWLANLNTKYLEGLKLNICKLTNLKLKSWLVF